MLPVALMLLGKDFAWHSAVNAELEERCKSRLATLCVQPFSPIYLFPHTPTESSNHA